MIIYEAFDCIFSFLFFIFSDEFYWILYQEPEVIFQYYKNVNLILASIFLFFFFCFGKLIFLFFGFPESVGSLLYFLHFLVPCLLAFFLFCPSFAFLPSRFYRCFQPVRWAEKEQESSWQLSRFCFPFWPVSCHFSVITFRQRI